MDSERWRRIQNIFHDAASLPIAEQQSFLDTACGEDGELASEVRAMLQQDAVGGSLLDRSLAEVAHGTLTAPRLAGATEFGPYRIVGVLGEGGMGVVYLAERKVGGQVAIKLLRDAWLSPSRRERFASEQRTLAQLNHPSIARLYDAATLDDGTPYFVMEYVEGVPLTEYCRQHQCSIEERLRLIRSVCEAVQHAHGNAVIHRDLKPSNILVKADGSVRLLDFGIAKQIESLELGVDQTMTGLRLMTPAYAAPEQIRSDRIGIATDVYSLGVILYELLTGELPFDLSNLTPAEAATIVADHEPGKPSAAVRRGGDGQAVLSRTAWADLDVLCLTAMHKDPRRRYSSVEALIRDVDHYLNGEPLEARRDSLRYRAAKFVRRNRRAVTTAALVGAMILGLVAFFAVRLARARDAAMAEAARTQRIQQFMTSLFQGGDEAAGPADSLRVVTIVDRGVQQAKSLSNDPAVQADLYETLGGIYQKLGKLEQADGLLQSALTERKTIFGADSPQVAQTLTALALLRIEQGRLDEAEQIARQALAMERRHSPADSLAVAKAMLAYGRVLAERGSHAEAIAMLNEAVRIESAPGVPPADLAASLAALADVQYQAGHYDLADSLYRRLLIMHRQLYGDQHPLVADDLGNLGSIQQDLGYYAEAERFDREALAITEAYYGQDNPETAAHLTMLARALLFQKKFDDATALLEQALAIQEHTFGATSPSVAKTLNELGNVAVGRGDLDEAEARFGRVVEIYRAIYGDHHHVTAVALSNLASVYSNKKEYARAEPLFRDVVRTFSETLSPGNVNTGIARVKLGRTLLRQNRYAEAEAETRAGYEILIQQTNPSSSFVHAARTDLVAEYEALKEPQMAAKFRAELAEGQAPGKGLTP